ncbi:MAG: type IX secretion system outer membrane channel protein PorV [Flavobacteriaceae bacterium]
MYQTHRFLLYCGLLLVLTPSSRLMGQNSERVITTGVPFLLITPDARAAGMGDLGVATTPDAYSQQWNPAKYPFHDIEKGIGVSYTPYLSKLVNDIFLGNLTYYRKIGERGAWGGSLKYFSLGDIQFNEVNSGTIINQGVERPNELTLDLSYSLKLSDQFAMAVAGRYIRSDLKITSDLDAASANTLGVDLAAYYQSTVRKVGSNSMRFRSGVNISNLGPRLVYDIGGQKNFLPTNLKVGTSADWIFDSNSSMSINVEFNKLLVPSPVATINDTGTLIYAQPDVNFLQGMLDSFNDAQDGFSEELKEITWATGLEYQFQKVLALRTGYFNESKEKGSRRFVTFGAGLLINQMQVDISYLFSTSTVRSPLENTLRFSLSFDLVSGIVVPEEE